METTIFESSAKRRTLELNAYRSVVDALRAQGPLTQDKRELLTSLSGILNVSEGRRRSEIRRAANDETLASIARRVSGRESEYTWRTESMRKIPLVSMVAPETIYTPLADTVADIVSYYNQQLCSSSTQCSSFEEIRTANTQANVERIAEEKLLEPMLAEIRLDEKAIVKELMNISQFNKFTHPEEYLRSTNWPPEDETITVENPQPHDADVLPPVQAVFSPPNNSRTDALIENVAQSSAVDLETNLKDVSEIKDQEPVSSVPLKSKKKAIKPNPVAETHNDERESTRMVRKAKLNAKRWNPKTKTLESPTKGTPENCGNGSGERCVAKTKPPARKKVKKVTVRQPSTNEDGDTAEKTMCSTQRGRKTARWYWGRKRRRQAKKSENAEPVTSVEDLNEKLKNTTDPKEKLKIALAVDLKNSIKAAEDRSRSKNDSRVSAKKVNNKRFEAGWLHSLNSIPTSRPINILRKRVCTGGAQIPIPNKKPCNPSRPVKDSIEKFVDNLIPNVVDENEKSKNSPPRSTVNVPNEDITILSATKSSIPCPNYPEIVSDEETARIPVTASKDCVESSQEKSESNEIVDNSSPSNIPCEEGNRDSVMKSQELFGSSSPYPSNEGMDFERSTYWIGSDERSSTDVSKVQANCDLRTASKVGTSTTDSSIEKINCVSVNALPESIGTAPMLKSNEKMNCASTHEQPNKSVHNATSHIEKKPDHDSAINSKSVKDNIPLIPVEPPKNGGRVKILPAGCGKVISQQLLGSSVRVRTVQVRNKDSPKFVCRESLPSSGTRQISTNEKDDTAEENARESSPIEHLSEITDENPCILMTEEVLSSSDDDIRSSSPANSIHESVADHDDIVILSGNTEQKRKSVSNNEDSVIASSMTEQSVENVIVDTISEINDDWKEMDSVVTNEISDIGNNNKKNDVESAKTEVPTSSMPLLSKARLAGPLSTMIGLPPWAPKIISANSFSGTTYRQLVASKSLQTYVPKKVNNSSISVIKPSLTNREMAPVHVKFDPTRNKVTILDVKNNSAKRGSEVSTNKQQTERKNGSLN